MTYKHIHDNTLTKYSAQTGAAEFSLDLWESPHENGSVGIAFILTNHIDNQKCKIFMTKSDLIEIEDTIRYFRSMPG